MIATCDGLAAHHLTGVGVVRQAGIARQLPSIVERIGDSIAEGRVVGPREVSVTDHRANASRTDRPLTQAGGLRYGGRRV